MTIRLLAVTDEVDTRIYSPTIGERMNDVEMVISCGDLPASYLEFLCDAINKPVYYVLGNHAEELTRGGERGALRHPEGCIDLNFNVVEDRASGMILAGLPGCLRYSNHEPVQYTEFQMTLRILRMAPRLLWNRLRKGRALDVLVTHAPPLGLNDGADHAHRGFNAMRRFIRWFHPAHQLHGHIHRYDRTQPNVVSYEGTTITNVFPYQRLNLDVATVTNPQSCRTETPAAQETRSGQRQTSAPSPIFAERQS